MESIDWKNLSFGYSKTDYNVRSWYRNGQWSELEVSNSEVINIHMAATSLHYGQRLLKDLRLFVAWMVRLEFSGWLRTPEGCNVLLPVS